MWQVQAVVVDIAAPWSLDAAGPCGSHQLLVGQTAGPTSPPGLNVLHGPKAAPGFVAKTDLAIPKSVVRLDRHYWADIRTYAWAFVVQCETCVMDFNCSAV
jgi:hypothetical protein